MIPSGRVWAKRHNFLGRKAAFQFNWQFEGHGFNPIYCLPQACAQALLWNISNAPSGYKGFPLEIFASQKISPGVMENPRRIGRAVLLGRVWVEDPRLWLAARPKGIELVT
ncbi:hypothetical protein [Shewanella gelidii]|uniref:hypothetical protein n=1 Tax=Shewanella gelidii TaxID=1642821 RepID=UPI00166E65AF|nr:hypothetical protein [Shewanella gelidii]MCL1097560.1 hypothetical protein [Shewanella gelidii]